MTDDRAGYRSIIDAYNELLRRLDGADRDVLARLLDEVFVSGVHQALVALHEAEVPSFRRWLRRTPFHDFIGRLTDWPWPESSS